MKLRKDEARILAEALEEFKYVLVKERARALRSGGRNSTEFRPRTFSPPDAKPKLYEVLIINYINLKQWNTKVNYTEK